METKKDNIEGKNGEEESLTEKDHKQKQTATQTQTTTTTMETKKDNIEGKNGEEESLTGSYTNSNNQQIIMSISLPFCQSVGQTITQKITTQPVNHPVSQPGCLTCCLSCLSCLFCKPVSLPVAQPTSKFVSEPNNLQVSQPSSQPFRPSQSAFQPASLPPSQLSIQQAFQPASQPSSQPIDFPASQPSNQPISLPASQPSNQPISLPASQPSNQPISLPASQPSSQPVSLPASQISNQSATHSVSEPENRTVIKEKDIIINKEATLTQKNTVLFLLGKTGQGKSETGNNILGKKFFDASDSSSSKTIKVKAGYGRRQGRKIKVVDGPGVGETRMSHEDAEEKMAKDMQMGVSICPEGIDALILVLKYGNRFTEEEWATVCALKNMFGESFIRDYCIIIFTHGDNFQKQNRQTPDKTFENWCSEQKGKLEELFVECEYRTVLFDNFSDPEQADSQLAKLLDLVDDLNNGVRYTNKIFEMAGEARKKTIAQKDSWKVAQENIYSKLQFIIDGLERLKSHDEMNYEACELLENLRLDATELLNTIDIEDKGTGALKPLRQIVTGLLKSINKLGAQARSDEELATANKQFSEEQKKLQEEVDKVDEPSFWNTVYDTACDFGQKALVYTLKSDLIKAIPGGSMIAGAYNLYQNITNSE